MNQPQETCKQNIPNSSDPISFSVDGVQNSSVANRLLLSVVIPCLNEADTIETCVLKASRSLTEMNVAHEIIVADNGSMDGSQELARRAGARVVAVAERGYGAALMGGINASRGEWILMGDADDSYDFSQASLFASRINESSLVKTNANQSFGKKNIDSDSPLRSNQVGIIQGCRFPSGGGQIEAGAMPWLHRWFGNPLLSWLVRKMFRIPIQDVYCGMRAFRRNVYDSLDLRSKGMEFATEMIIKAGTSGVPIEEIGIRLSKDGRKAHGPHLRTFRDGWRTLRLFLAFSPYWSFFVPGCVLLAFALVGYALALPQANLFGIAIDVHSLLVASLLGLMGWQCILLSVLARIFAGREGMLPPETKLERISVEFGLFFAIGCIAIGFGLIGIVVFQWWRLQFGRLDYPQTMRLVVPGIMLAAIGFQTAMVSLFAGVLKMQRPKTAEPKTADLISPE